MEKVLYNALLDTGARHNLLSYGVWCQLGKPTLSESTIHVKGINKKTSKVLGILNTPIAYDNGVVVQDFLVMPTGTMEGNINLGRTWMSATRCNIDWETRHVTTQKPTMSLTAPATKPEPQVVMTAPSTVDTPHHKW